MTLVVIGVIAWMVIAGMVVLMVRAGARVDDDLERELAMAAARRDPVTALGSRRAARPGGTAHERRRTWAAAWTTARR